MFDEYLPDPPIHCPSCSAVPARWQGKDGPCFLLVWRQGNAHPTKQLGDEPLGGDDLSKLRLPGRFRMYADCPNGHALEAEGQAIGGTWTRTSLRTA
jgi:hypothetical protein